MSSATVCSYRVIHCSSYDKDSHPNDLVNNNEQLLHLSDNLEHQALTNPNAKGWLTTPRCKYPQEIVLCLSSGLTLVDRLDLLAHNAMIPSRVDVYLGLTKSHDNRKLVQFNRLGFVSIGDKKDTDYSVRELKSISIGYNTEYIRIVLWDCHKNMLNQYNQAGFAAIRIVGRRLEGHRDGNISRATASSISTVCSDDLEADLRTQTVDVQLKIWINALIERKKACVQVEDYQGARLCKHWSRQLLTLASEIDRLDVLKLRAAEVEDFDKAETLKITIRDKRMDARIQMAKDGIQIADDGTILQNQFDQHMEKQSDMSDDTSSNEDETSKSEQRSIAISSNSFVSPDNQGTSFQTFIPTLRTSTVIKKTSSRSLNSEKVVIVNSSKESAAPIVVSHKSVSPEESGVDTNGQQKTPPLISFSPTPDDKSISALNVHTTTKPSLIPTLSENTRSASRNNSKVTAKVKGISSQNSSDNDLPATSVGASEENQTNSRPSNSNEEVEKEAGQPRRGTVAKLEKQLAELRMMAATSGQAVSRSTAESGIPKSASMIKKASVESLKKPAISKPERTDISNAVVTEKKVLVSNPQVKRQSSTRARLPATTLDRTPKSHTKIKAAPRSRDKAASKTISREKSEDKKKSSTCIFCEEQNDSFNEDTLISHYWNDCPVLTSCPLCQIILEISTLNEHIMADCEERHRVKRCTRCKDIIPIDQWLGHSFRQNCTGKYSAYCQFQRNSMSLVPRSDHACNGVNVEETSFTRRGMP
ncbi:hypothetical protein INT43_002518 [Umbelopsis isabellina]|uniref:Uncharacterized protein n=1 Tax=Mortierella isabellina TaxID=91625 RepID=A0A8H7UK36_MORIS|nr:hypothetical protein INT43_002518 [Umbelopsis isabellina]